MIKTTVTATTDPTTAYMIVLVTSGLLVPLKTDSIYPGGASLTNCSLAPGEFASGMLKDLSNLLGLLYAFLTTFI